MESETEKFRIVLDELRKISAKQDTMDSRSVELDKKLDLHVQKTDFQFRRLSELDEQQNRLIDQHIEGVRTLKKIVEQNKESAEARIKELEKPTAFLQTAWGLLLKLGLFAGTAAAIGAFGVQIKEFIRSIWSSP